MATASQKTLDDQGWVDALTSFTKGINSSLVPLLLPNDTLAFAVNATVRGGYVTHRPCLKQIILSYANNTALQTAFETGTFQGGGFYQPQTGQSTLIAQISGRLFQFTPSATGSTGTVVEITIPGDPNPSSVQQVWMWQSEQFMIINDGQSLPIFFDGNTSRRSLGSVPIVFGTLGGGAPYTAPAVNTTVAVTLNAAFTGTPGQTVIINGATYQAVPAAGAFQANLTNTSAPPGTVYPIGTNIYKNPNVFGNLSKDSVWNGAFYAGTITPAFVLPVGTPIIPSGTTIAIKDSLGFAFPFLIVSHAPSLIPGYPGTLYTVEVLISFGGPVTFLIGAQVTNYTYQAPVLVVATLQAPFTAPPIGTSALATITSPYSGPANEIVKIGTGGFTIQAVPPGPGGVNLTLKNINDVPANTTTLILNAQLLSVPELPAGRMGAYVLGRNWMALTDGRSFIASDIVNGPSGTPAYNYRDAVLKVSENTFLYEGGTFVVPGTVGDIRSITAAVTLDASLGQGPVMVGTSSIMFSCNAPVDRSTWETITNPILTESLIGYGPQGQNSTIAVNSDILFRTSVTLGSLIQGRREFYSWGNTGIGNEVQRILKLDNEALLQFGSSINADNRFLDTSMPTQSSQGFYHPGLVALDFFPISNMQEKLPAVYDGLWTGVNAFQWITGPFSSIQRSFAFCLNKNASKIEVFELLNTGDANFDSKGGVDVPITWEFESASMFKHVKTPAKGPMDLCRLMDGEIYVSDVVGTVDFQVFYKPDQYPCWIPWFNWSICQNQANTANPNRQPTFVTRMGLGAPDPVPCDNVNDRPLREGYTFQVKFIITGHCVFLGGRFRAFPIPDAKFAKPICDAPCQPQLVNCIPAIGP